MPKILIYKFLTFYFYAGDVNERGHVHIINSKSYTREAKIWFEGNVSIFEKGNLSQTELNTALKIIENNNDFLKLQWESFKKGQTTKIKVLKKI